MREFRAALTLQPVDDPAPTGVASGARATARSTAITQWVEQNFTAQTVGGTTIYDLSTATS